jgi:hypothetical protein
MVAILHPSSEYARMTAAGFMMGVAAMNASVGPRYAPE